MDPESLDPESLVIAAVLAGLFATLAFPTLPLQHWINSRFLSLCRMAKFRPIGLAGRWLAVYKLRGDSSRYEIVHSNQLFGDEVRGVIRDEANNATYKFMGRIIFDEIVAFYWPTDGSRDMGTFKLLIDAQAQMAMGSLSVWDSLARSTRTAVDYEWRRYSSAPGRKFKRVREGHSKIHNTGLFATTRFDRDQQIGELHLGPEQNQGEHTIKFNDKDRMVKKPWRFLNHACEPNARLVFRSDKIVVIAKQEVLPQAELTIDYRILPERVSQRFECKCPKCACDVQKAQIGG